ncbi:hypothetical protein MicloDRAFT_00049650 [Microvirga lotononidis]|uniref:Uncharacterized protein n=1 Tax=Microvirga lotononidis TaxID=864069 RepID=I4YWP0_9HYPH|nr:hypothetical protein MicloDRAFT_00049650 [Microvirga lotononidis]
MPLNGVTLGIAALLGVELGRQIFNRLDKGLEAFEASELHPGSKPSLRCRDVLVFGGHLKAKCEAPPLSSLYWLKSG